MQEIENLYSDLGGKFISPINDIKSKLSHIKAFVFDWDGVFNNGQKGNGGSSDFSEVDSMGTNLLRYSHFLKHGKLPLTAIISGEKNETAFYFCQRECFNYSFFKVAAKLNALNSICENENIQPNEIAYFFDDVLDLSIAEVCGVRILVNQKANPLFINYCVKNNLVDYLTASQGGQFAVREATELLIALNGNYDEVITNRKNSTDDYLSYIEKRKVVKTKFFTVIDNKIEQVNLT
ncbi:MAG: phosphatase [Bacteroidota bacterium]|nr:phosphatase [Bacteroidota bacterium]MDP3146275.1 phosphatase [Bacteroidota bacterium]